MDYHASQYYARHSGVTSCESPFLILSILSIHVNSLF